MKVQSIQTNQNYKNNAKNKIAFKATPQQILTAVETASICPGKKMFLGKIATFFVQAEEQLTKLAEAPEKFVFKLGQKNRIPKSMEQIKLDEMDEFLNNDGFKCSPTSTCNCGVGLSKGEFMKSLLEMIGIENPHEILIMKK